MLFSWFIIRTLCSANQSWYIQSVRWHCICIFKPSFFPYRMAWCIYALDIGSNSNIKNTSAKAFVIRARIHCTVWLNSIKYRRFSQIPRLDSLGMSSPFSPHWWWMHWPFWEFGSACKSLVLVCIIYLHACTYAGKYTLNDGASAGVRKRLSSTGFGVLT